MLRQEVNSPIRKPSGNEKCRFKERERERVQVRDTREIEIEREKTWRERK